MNEIPVMLSLREAASKSGLSYDFLRKKCLAHEIAHIRSGKKIFINWEKLLELLNREGTEDKWTESN